ncbi:unnamed protein product, partial [Adineta steineri]
HLLTSIVNGVFQTVDNLLGTLTQNGTLINQIIDSTGQIVNQVLGTAGNVLSSVVVGNFQQNMTFTGITSTQANGDVIKQYSYPPPAGSSSNANILVNIVFDSTGNVLSATVVNPSSTATSTTSSATAPSTAAPLTSTGPTVTVTTATMTSASPTVTSTTTTTTAAVQK